MTLRQRLTADKKKQRLDPNSISMGAAYYKHLREVYSSTNSPSQALVVKDMTEEVRKVIITCIENTVKDNPQRHHFLSFFQQCAEVNQREFVGIAKVVCRENPKGGKESLKFCLAFVQWVATNGFKDKYPEEIEILNEFIDLTLCAQLASMKRAGLSPVDFWTLCKPSAGVILNVAHVDALFQVTTTWADVDDQLDEVVASTQLGRALFGFATASRLAERVKEVIEEKVSGKGSCF